jgi:predicted XRE-type DNA-binding protein
MNAQRFDSVWDAIEGSLSEAANMKAQSDLMLAIREVVESWKVTQAEAAKRLGVTQPRMNDLVRGRIDKFSLDALMKLAPRTGLSVYVRSSELLPERSPRRVSISLAPPGLA